MKYFPNKNIKHWAFYDFANSSYVLIFQSFLIPLLFSKLLIDQGYDKLSWGLANGLSTLLGVILSIIIGRFADIKDRLNTFKYIVFITFVFIMLFSISISCFPKITFHLFIITNSLFITSIALSDSLLAFLSADKTKNEYSGSAWGFGYLGGIICLIFVMGLQKVTSEFSPFVFAFVGVFYLIFSIYALKGLQTDNSHVSFNTNEEKSIESKVGKSDLFKLLIGYWLIAEAITVYILFYSYYANEEVKMSTMEVSISLIIVQFVAIFSTWYGGKLADRYSSIKLLGYSIIIWFLIVTLMVFFPFKVVILLVVLLTGLVIGNSQSFLRAQFSSLVDKNRAGQQFGLYAVATQASVIVGPILHGYLSDKFNSQKIPLFILCLTMVVGFIIIRQVSKKYKFTVR